MEITKPMYTDVYKISHANMYPAGIQHVYATLTPRENSFFSWSDKMIVFGIKYWYNKLIEDWNENFFNLPKDVVVKEFQELCDGIVGTGNDMAERLGRLHDLGYLPIEVRALDEATHVKMGVPVMTIINTIKELI